MTDRNSTSMSTRTITAFFDKREAADRAAEQLTALGVPRERIRVTSGTKGGEATKQPAHKGFWEELKDLFLPEEDRYSYAEGLHRGGYLLSATVDEDLHDRALEALDTNDAVDMDEREASWRASGWTGYQGRSATAGAAGEGARRSGSSSATQLQSGREDVIPVYEETAKVGKRNVSHGRVRLRSYVVETPVSEQVNLRSEQVQVERRPVDRVVAAGDAAFKDRVIEAEERSEEAVISKETRVKEEIGLRKTVENQAQTVSDTVRRTQVDVQDERSGKSLGGKNGLTSSSDAHRIAEHMDVIASDGAKIGTVDHLEGERIKLAKSTSPDGQHHYIPLAFIDHVDSHVHLRVSTGEAKSSW